MLGRREPFDAVPFFWSQHYDVTIRYVGHAEGWDSVKIEVGAGALDGAGANALIFLLRSRHRTALNDSRR